MGQGYVLSFAHTQRRCPPWRYSVSQVLDPLWWPHWWMRPLGYIPRLLSDVGALLATSSRWWIHQWCIILTQRISRTTETPAYPYAVISEILSAVGKPGQYQLLVSSDTVGTPVGLPPGPWHISSAQPLAVLLRWRHFLDRYCSIGGNCHSGRRRHLFPPMPNIPVRTWADSRGLVIQ